MIKNRKTIPTIVGLVTLIIGIATGVLLVKNKQLFKFGAEPELNPKDIRISNIDHSSFTISWSTAKKVQGFVVWGNSRGLLNKTALSTTGPENDIHSITLENLSPETSYYFKINSGGYEFDNEGIPWQIKTGPELPGPSLSKLISGSVLASSGSPAEGVIVYVTVGGSSLLSTLTTEEGDWIIPISNARVQNLASYISIDEASSLVEISVQGGSLGVASAQIYPQSAKPAPPIFLGGTHNFKTASPSINSEVPAATIELPEESTPSSGFDLPDKSVSESEEETATDAATLTSTPTLPPGTACDCLEIKVFDSSWNLIADLTTIEVGNTVRFTVGGYTNTGTIDKARFTINGELMPETSNKRPGTDEFYLEYEIPTGVSNFTVKGEIHHTELDWI